MTQERETVKAEHEEVKHQIALARLVSAESCHLNGEYSTGGTFPWSTELDRVRREVFGIAEFRPLQLLAINAFLDKRDVILVMPTGMTAHSVNCLECPLYACFELLEQAQSYHFPTL